ncbi:hypothetical protein K439DRAFT_1641715 [Ramaria rubella]|nr:hypothetical protein K439DRAFT_1641715 [Ramaria rubella]
MIHNVDHRNRLQQTTLTSHSIATDGNPLAPDLRFHLQSCESSIDDFQESSSRFGRGPVASS